MELANDVLKAVTVILRASQAIHEVIRKDVAKYGLNPTEFSVLELLYHKGNQPIQMIGKKVLISSSSITYVIDKLEQKQYVRREGCPEDRRVIYTVLTSKGKALMDEIFPKHVMKISEVFTNLDNNQMMQVVTLLKQVGCKAKQL
ncbi:MarR family 2-MHQ and catechol resistance regulon transcriptional repressor [Cytobacillus eiseniae]|uniref:MarR family 2-MHQ and catechol resistance regulon transcriptional repressor n=1 Tax=Cytobacillus eiseniae TaxID=762947 RepID=A0ABS4RA39_9BACI|nr:MarR family transcriptional regulator [Cytobacillus eiseniae]MBP2239757.1 MarR family 2-MHQ and catechol resistance regulon transcriptional repressor [Cytobacillus eiseniae]